MFQLIQLALSPWQMYRSCLVSSTSIQSQEGSFRYDVEQLQ